MTLIELLVWTVLSMIVLGIGAELLWQVFRSTARGTVIGQLEQSVATIEQRLVLDLQKTSPNAVTMGQKLAPDGYNFVAIQPVKDVDGTGLISYSGQDSILYFWSPNTPVLRRRIWPYTPPPVAYNDTQPVRLADKDILTLTNDNNALESQVSDVTAFLVYSPDFTAPNVGSPLQISIEMRRQATSGFAAESFRMDGAWS